MALFADFLVNVWRGVRNVYARLSKRAPDYIVLDVGGSLPEFESRVGFVRRRLSPRASEASLEGLRTRLKRISDDGRVRGIVLRIQGLNAGWASLEELRAEIAAFRRKGGRVVAYLIEADSGAYYLACAADEVLATPLATLGVVGIRTRTDFLKDGLERAGVEAEVFAVSPYKSAGDRFARRDFSPEAREQAERLQDCRYEELVRAISEGRNLGPDEVRRKIDGAPYGTKEALSEGLLDGVCYEDELPGRLGAGGRAEVSEWDASAGSLRMPYRKSGGKRVGVVSLSGTIVRGKSRKLPLPLPLFGQEQAGSESVVAALRMAEKNRRVASVLFYVDSRGGDSLASDLIWREVGRVNAKKPVVVLMGEAAASGGYYVSASASHIVARRNTITGSIGVISLRPVAVNLYEKLGVNPVAIERGAHSGLGDPGRASSEEEAEVFRRQVQTAYAEFKDRVTLGRGIDAARLESIAGGRVWTGGEAHEHGLVDEVGGYREALGKARELAGIDKDAPGDPVKISPPKSGRPAPGDPSEAPAEAVRAAFDVARVLLDEVRGSGTWAIAPYTFYEDS
ncbi:MAG: signal peptide peptidase SppA [Rubrobacteraceae bacterium]